MHTNQTLRQHSLDNIRQNLRAAAYYRAGGDAKAAGAFECVPGTEFANAMWEACMRNVRNSRRHVQFIYNARG